MLREHGLSKDQTEIAREAGTVLESDSMKTIGGTLDQVGIGGERLCYGKN